MDAPRLPDRDLGPEWMLLELLCLGLGTGEQRRSFHQTIQAGQVDHGELIEQAMRHRLLPKLAYHLLDADLAANILPQLRNELVVILTDNRRRLGRLLRTAAELVQRLRQAGVDAAATKGVALEPTVYGGLGTRRMTDVDLVIRPEDRATVSAVMHDLGYRHGLYDGRAHAIVDLPREMRAVYRLSPDHLPHFLRLEPDGAGTIVVDFSNSFTWARSRWKVPVDEALAQAATVDALDGGVQLPVLPVPYLFLYVVLHLFRESWFEQTIAAGKDMLYKFGDVIALWELHEDSLAATLPGLVDDHGLAEPVAWVLEHTDRTFHTAIVERLGLGHAVSEDWLASAYGSGGVQLRWHGTMRQRLHARDRAGLLSRIDDVEPDPGSGTRAAPSASRS